MSIWLSDYHDSNFRILFQNADNTINMVKVCQFHNTRKPVPKSGAEIKDLAWYRMLADIMLHTYKNVQDSSTGKLITLSEENGYGYMSCYVELHSPGFI